MLARPGIEPRTSEESGALPTALRGPLESGYSHRVAGPHTLMWFLVRMP